MIKALSDNIQALIEIRGIQVGKLEKQLGVSAGYFSRVRRGMSISSEVLYNLSKVMDVSMDDLCSKGYKNRLIRDKVEQLNRMLDDRAAEWEYIGGEDVYRCSNCHAFMLGNPPVCPKCYSNMKGGRS